ncbi:peroxidasin [Agrilus planipennis]|uniref:Peroxidasin n=1 Tax=Agrilus planipennis TaxID=224129 RepID=A0A1W4XC42_AGRPL|nr:peroxidasin [Agrilus planipennis]
MRSSISFFFVLCCLAEFVSAQYRNLAPSVCPSSCICYRRNVRCVKKDLQEIPKVPVLTNILDLKFNKIRDIHPGIFQHHVYMKSLLLNDNLLSSLRNGAFTGLAQLKHLSLHKNRIRYIEPEVFHGLYKLEYLYLYGNEIQEFDAKTFTNLPSLSRLFLHNNKISHILMGSFEGLPKLSRLRLDSNALVCDCDLLMVTKMLEQNSVHTGARCKYPDEMYGKSLTEMSAQDVHCEKPGIIQGPRDVEVSWGGIAVFTCKVEGPSTSVEWMKNEVLIEQDDRYKIMDDGSLMIKNSEDKDEGTYECMVKSPQGEVHSQPAKMIVVKDNDNEYRDADPQKPTFVVRPQKVDTSVGAREIKLNCKAIGNPKPVITWSQNGITLALDSRRFLENGGNLVIRTVEPSDDGIYQCDASNVHGRVSTSAVVNINTAPSFTIHPQSADVQRGATLRLECAAVASPFPQITWFKENIQLTESARIRFTPDKTVLEIQHVEDSDSGLYICEAKNNMGKRETSANVKVLAHEEKEKPPILIYKPYDIEAVLGGTIELPCKSEGIPTPGIQWRKDGSTMQRTGRFRISIGGNLYIYNVQPDDAGRYECTAINDHGSISASGYLTVKQQRHNSGINLGDKFVKIAFAEATDEVDRAINNTIDFLFNNPNATRTSADIFRIIRYPNAPARELARAAEVYERTLVNIRKHVERGMSANLASDFNYREILSPEHLELVAKLSGCTAHRRARNCTDMCYHKKYRSIDGTCNNLQNPTWGASLTGFRRILKPIYENGFSTPIGWNSETKYYGFKKPSSRLVSTTLLSTKTISSDDQITHMVMQWGQFLDHDLDHALPSVSSQSWDGIDCKKSCDYAAPCFPMDVPPNDPRIQNRRCIDFIRTSSICGSGMTSVFFGTVQPREQINQLTSYIDASQVYGFSEELARDLRDLTNDHGYLRTGRVIGNGKPLLPFANGDAMDCRRNLSESSINCFLAGDIRANEQVGLIAMHTVWMREHNRIADELYRYNPHWDGETLYQEARKIVSAAMQHITYKLWLPYIIGKEGLEMLGEYKEYNPKLNPSISNVFATAALRFGHTLINPVLHRLDSSFSPINEGHLPLHKAFFSPWRVVDEGGIDPLLRGFFTVAAKVKKPNENLNAELTERLFESAHAVALDLAAMNIQRSRDHAIPGYIEFRKFCNMSEVDTFNDLRDEITDPEIRRKLKDLYGHPGNIDVFVGGVLEDPVPGGRVGPLFRCLLVEQFRRLRDGDRFWYENPSVFKPEQLVQIKQYSVSRVLCDNGDNITRVTQNSFLLPERQGGYVSCSKVPKVDLRLWTECCNDCRASTQFNTISRFGRTRRDANEYSPRGSYLNSTYTETDENKIKRLVKKIDDLESEVHGLLETLKQIRETQRNILRRL